MPPAVRVSSVILLLLPCLACAQQPPPAARPEIRAEPVGSAADPLPGHVGLLDLEGAWALTGTTPAFGGISGIRRDGDRLLLLSDRSRLFELAWQPPAAGRPFVAAILQELPLAGASGRPLDAEALAVLPDGRLAVADEGRGRLEFFASGSARATGSRPVPGLAPSDGTLNEGLETLAVLPDGSWLAISEGGAEGGSWHPAVWLRGDAPEPLRYQAAAGFKPTDADVAGDQLFVLERRLSLLGGWQARIVAVPLASLPDRPDSPIVGRELATLSGRLIGENHEGLAASLGEDGAYRLLVIADDNLNALQQTLLLALRWRPSAG
jgi:hypothetical protein